MPVIRRPAIAAFLACGLALPALAQDQVTADTVVATVGGTEITAGHLYELRKGLPQQFQGLPDRELYKGLLDQIVRQEALAAQVGEPSRSVRNTLENERRAIYAQVIIRRVAENALTEEAIAAAYEERFANATPEPEYNASHILVESEEAAREIKALLDGGEDFAEMAKARSTGPSGPSGGSLGWFGPGMMVPPFEEAVVALVPGQISEPVQTQFGWHVIKLNDSRLQEAPELDEVREQIEAELVDAALSARIDEALAALDVTQTTVDEIDPSFLSNPALFEE